MDHSFLAGFLINFNTKCLSCSHRQTNIGVLGALILTILAGCNLTVPQEEIVGWVFKIRAEYSATFLLSLHMDVKKKSKYWKGTTFTGETSERLLSMTPLSGYKFWTFCDPSFQNSHSKTTSRRYYMQCYFGISKGMILTSYIISWCHDEWYIRTDDPVHLSHRRWKNWKHGKRTSFQLRR